MTEFEKGKLKGAYAVDKLVHISVLTTADQMDVEMADNLDVFLVDYLE